MGTASEPIPSTPHAAPGGASSQPVPEVLVRSLDFLVGWHANAFSLTPAPPKSLYRYTDASALVSISTGQELWATNAVFMNDQTEVSHAATLLGALLAENHDTGSVERPEPDLAVRQLLSF